jgi:HTH-type transcriptional regulator / antitoxin HipB
MEGVVARFGAAVVARRRELGLRQDELADLAGVSTRFVHTLEADKPSLQLDRVEAVLDVLGLELRVERRAATSTPEGDT